MASHLVDSSLTEFIAGQGKDGALSRESWFQRLLCAIRAHLGMKVAFISEFKDGRRVFIYVDSSDSDCPIAVGGSDPLDDSYCQKVVDGRLPELIQDAAMIPEARLMPVTAALPVGAHLSVPIRLKSGQVYGTLCCFSYTPDRTLHERDLNMMRVFAEIAAAQIERDIESEQSRTAIEGRIKSVLSNGSLSMVYQPIHYVEDNALVGFESLARFTSPPPRGPDVWFGEAEQVGLALELESCAIKLALQGASPLPGDVFVSVNVSPETVIRGDLESLFEGWPADRLVLEVTEHVIVKAYGELDAALKGLRDQGARLAIDDVGAGYANFRHILNLEPEIIKLDTGITRNIDTDHSRRALAAALVSFADETGMEIVAEGVETAVELEVLRELGVNKAQGYFLGRPMGIGSAVEYAQRSACH